MNKKSRVKEILNGISTAWTVERPTRQAAALAYYSLFSLVPIVYISLTVAGIFIDVLDVTTQLYSRIESTLGSEVAELVEGIVMSASDGISGGTVLATLISFLAMVFAASGLFANLKFSLDSIWHVSIGSSADQGVIQMIRERLVAFLIVISMGLLLVVLVALNSIFSFLNTLIVGDQLLGLLNNAALFFLAWLIIAVFYKTLPDTKIKWGDVWLGAFITVILIVVMVIIAGFYLTSANFGSAFEIAGGLAIILIFINLIATIFLLGAVFSREYAYTYGSRAGVDRHWIDKDTSSEST
jgi:membrane protein